MHSKGEGIPQNLSEALKWYRKAADQGHAKAQNDLGVLYYEGEGVPKNYKIIALLTVMKLRLCRPVTTSRWWFTLPAALL